MATKLIIPPRTVSTKFSQEETEKFEIRSQREFYEKLASLLTIEDWQAPTLLNGWVDYGYGFAPAGFYKDPFGRVHLRGVINGGTTTLRTVLFTLPLGYRPQYETLHFVGTSGTNPARIGVFTNGDVLIYQGSNVWLSLDDISFRAA